jgi:hypothetical protein
VAESVIPNKYRQHGTISIYMLYSCILNLNIYIQPFLINSCITLFISTYTLYRCILNVNICIPPWLINSYKVIYISQESSLEQNYYEICRFGDDEI